MACENINIYLILSHLFVVCSCEQFAIGTSMVEPGIMGKANVTDLLDAVLVS